MDDEPRVSIEFEKGLWLDFTEVIRPLIRWEIAQAIAQLGPSPVEPLPLDEFDDDIAPRSLRFP